MLVKFRLMHPHLWLFSRSTKNELPTGFVHPVGKILQCLQAGGIDGGHIAESENNDGRQMGQTIDHHIDLVGCAKQERAVDPEDADVSRNFFVLQDMNVPLSACPDAPGQ
jgi:hypothetical protein